jgi:hypothetical protein
MSTQQDPNSNGVTSNGGSSSTSVNISQFQEGMSGITTSSLLEIMVLYTEISNLYKSFFMDQLTVQNDTAIAVGNYEKQYGKDQEEQAYTQGLATTVGGGLTVTAGTGALGADLRGTPNFDAEVQGARNYQQELENPSLTPDHAAFNVSEDGRAEGVINSHQERQNALIEGIGNRETFSTESTSRFGYRQAAEVSPEEKQAIANLPDSEREELKTSYNEKVKNVEQRRDMQSQKTSNRARNLTEIATGLGSLSSGTGNVISSKDQFDQGVDQKNKDLGQAALSNEQSIASTFSSDISSYMTKSSDVTSAMTAISQANKS